VAIAFDAYATGAAGTGDLSFTLTPVGTPKGVVVYVAYENSITNQISGVTYGGVSMAAVAGSPVIYDGGEDVQVAGFFLGSGVPTGAQTVSVTVTGAATKKAWAISATAGADTAVQATTTVSSYVSDPTGTISLTGESCLVVQGFSSGLGAVTNTTAKDGWTKTDEYDFGFFIGGIHTYGTVGTSDVTVGYNSIQDETALLAVAIKESAGGGGTTLSPSLLTNSQTFYAPTVSAGAVSLTPSLYSNAQTFYAATVSQGGATQALTPGLFSNSSTFYAPTVTPGSVTLTPGLFSNSQTFYSPSVVAEGGPQTLTPSLVSNTNEFYAANVTTGAVTITPALFANTNTFFAPTVSQGFADQTLTPSLAVNTQQFFTAIVTTGGVTLTPSLFSNVSTFYAPLVTGGEVVAATLSAPRVGYSNTQTASRSNTQTARRPRA